MQECMGDKHSFIVIKLNALYIVEYNWRICDLPNTH